MTQKILSKVGVILFASTIGTAFGQTYPCPTNGNAESNNFTNWTTYTAAATAPLNGFTQNFDASRFGVHDENFTGYNLTNGVEDYGDFPIPSEGTYCFRVGNTNVAQAEAMRYTFTVTNQNKHFKLRYALVLEDPGHDESENPGAAFYFIRETFGNGISPSWLSLELFHNTKTEFIADLNNPYYSTSTENSNVVYRPWECIEFDLSSYVGETISFIALVKDCELGGHFGYMYLDGLCTNWPAIASASLNGNEFCLEDEIIMDGSASEGEDRYFVEVAEVDANNAYVSGGLVINDWFIAEEAPANFNLSDYIASKNKQLECGKRYKAKLAVANQCAEWNETNLYFNIVCPEVDAGPDITECCDEGVVMDYTIGANSIPGNTYLWSSIPAGFSGNTSSVSITNNTQSTAYIIEMMTPDGCTGRDTVLFRKLPSQFNVSLTRDYELCDYAPYITAHASSPAYCAPDPEFEALFGSVDHADINWSFQPTGGSAYSIGSGKTIQAPNADGTLTVLVTTALCNGSGSQSMQLEYRPGDHALIAPNAFTPDNGSSNNIFRILEAGPSAPINVGDGPAYDIQDFKLRIWNRWGDNFKTITKADAGRLPNENVMQGDIFWDGTNGSGNVVQDGVYNYTLEMQYCGQNNFTQICMDGSEVDPCVRWVWFFCVERLSGCVSPVTVVQ